MHRTPNTQVRSMCSSYWSHSCFCKHSGILCHFLDWDCEFFIKACVIQLCGFHSSLYKRGVWKADLFSGQPLIPEKEWIQPRVTNNMYLRTKQAVETQEILSQVGDNRVKTYRTCLRIQKFQKECIAKTTMQIDWALKPTVYSPIMTPPQPLSVTWNWWASCHHCNTSLIEWRPWLNSATHGSHLTQCMVKVSI